MQAATLLRAAFAPAAAVARPPARPLRPAAALPFAGREEAMAVEIGRREAVLSLTPTLTRTRTRTLTLTLTLTLTTDPPRGASNPSPNPNPNP